MQLWREKHPRPEIGGDLLRVHQCYFTIVGCCPHYSALYMQQGIPESRTLKGFRTYVWCLVKLLHAHHVTEDKGMFPYLRPKLPNAPYEELMHQHSAMDPLLNEITGSPATSTDGSIWTNRWKTCTMPWNEPVLCGTTTSSLKKRILVRMRWNPF